MAWIAIVLKLIPAVIKLMRIAEELFDDVPESGAEKKAYVMAAIKAVVEATTGLGADDVLWGKIEKAIGLLIDAVCIFLFPKEAK